MATGVSCPGGLHDKTTSTTAIRPMIFFNVYLLRSDSTLSRRTGVSIDIRQPPYKCRLVIESPEADAPGPGRPAKEIADPSIDSHQRRAPKGKFLGSLGSRPIGRNSPLPEGRQGTPGMQPMGMNRKLDIPLTPCSFVFRRRPPTESGVAANGGTENPIVNLPSKHSSRLMFHRLLPL